MDRTAGLEVAVTDPTSKHCCIPGRLLDMAARSSAGTLSLLSIELRRPRDALSDIPGLL
jgi:hypothetical protein